LALLTCRLVLLFALTLGVPIGTLAAKRLGGDTSAKEYEVKAAFLFNFLRFSEWPGDTSSGDFVIGIVGKDPFGSTLDRTLQGKKINGRNVVAKRLGWSSDLRRVHLLFVPEGEVGRGANELKALRNAPVLVVGETPNFTSQFGTISFFLAGSNIRFEISPDAAKRSRITISSQLLQLAKITGGA